MPGRAASHTGDRRRRRSHRVSRRGVAGRRFRRVHGHRRRAGPRDRLHPAPRPHPARRHHAGHGRVPGVPRAAVRLHQGHPGGVPLRKDRARAHDGGQPRRSLRLHHQAVPLRPPAADHPRRAPRRQCLPRRDHRAPHAGHRAGRGTAHAARPRAARHHLHQHRRRAGTGTAPGVRGSGRCVPRGGPGAREGARRAAARRGLHLDLEPRRRVPHRAVAVAREIVHHRGGSPGRQGAARGEDAGAAREGPRGAPAAQGRPLRRRPGSGSRPRSASGARCSTPSRARPSRSRPSATRSTAGCANSSRRSWPSTSSPPSSTPSSTCRTSRLSGSDPVPRAERDGAAPPRRPLRGRAQRGPGARARPALPAARRARPASDCRRTHCASSTRSR